MEGKLIKMVEGYTLSLTGSVDDLYGISNNQLAEEHQLQKLSLKNCQVIENDYDLDELALLELPVVDDLLEPFQKLRREQWINGFQKALEILGDKKFSESDVMQAIITTQVSDSIKNNDDRLELIQSLQQTEWEVTFNPEEKDSNGCLILKRK